MCMLQNYSYKIIHLKSVDYLWSIIQDVFTLNLYNGYDEDTQHLLTVEMWYVEETQNALSKSLTLLNILITFL